jgi:hypothetical protein
MVDFQRVAYYYYQVVRRELFRATSMGIHIPD